MKILFVCTGNTCRSPMAEGLMRVMAQEAGKDVTVLSAGLFCANGAKATPQAIEAVKPYVDISSHESRPLSVAFMEAADLVIAMTEEHKRVLLRQFSFMADKIKTLAEWAGQDGDVEDPFGQNQEVYNACAAQIRNLLAKGLSKIDA